MMTLKKTLAEAGIDSSTIAGFSEIFDASSAYMQPFSGLQTQYLQLKFYQESFNLIVGLCILSYFSNPPVQQFACLIY